MLPARKNIRLKDYDYSQNGAYFITICSKDKKHFFWDNCVGAPIGRPNLKLSEYGLIVESAIKNIPVHYPSVSVDNYVIMPNHIHLLLSFRGDKSGRPMGALQYQL